MKHLHVALAGFLLTLVAAHSPSAHAMGKKGIVSSVANSVEHPFGLGQSNQDSGKPYTAQKHDFKKNGTLAQYNSSRSNTERRIDKLNDKLKSGKYSDSARDAIKSEIRGLKELASKDKKAIGSIQASRSVAASSAASAKKQNPLRGARLRARRTGSANTSSPGAPLDSDASASATALDGGATTAAAI